MRPSLLATLEPLALAAEARGMSRTQWAQRAGLPKETLSRLFHRADCDLSTLTKLAAAVGHRIDLIPEPDRVMPPKWDREAEDACLRLCASGTLDIRTWKNAGPDYFMAGLATLCANDDQADRDGYLALAAALCPAMRDPAEFARWLETSPARPSRFLPMLRDARRLAA